VHKIILGRKPVFASPWKSGLHPARFNDLSGTLPSQQSARSGNCLNADGASFAVAA
jgi:hypothetical protein